MRWVVKCMANRYGWMVQLRQLAKPNAARKRHEVEALYIPWCLRPKLRRIYISQLGLDVRYWYFRGEFFDTGREGPILRDLRFFI